MKRIILALCLVLVATNLIYAQKTKFGHVNTESVFSKMPEKEQVTKEMETYAKNLESQLMELNKDFEQKYTDFQANEASYSPSIKQMKYEELSSLQQRIQAFQVRAQEDMQHKQEELLAPLYTKIKNAIKLVGEEKSLIYVFEENTLLYISSESIDITQDVKNKLGIK